MGMPGPQPFFRGLWALMRLQVVPETIGGAGGNRIEWEIDDAVFKEAAGKEFMLEAIDVLKGVLAFEEVVSSKSPPSPIDDYYAPNTHHSRSMSQPLSSDQTIVRPNRARAPSDPFLDTPTLSRSVATSSSNSNTSALLAAEGDELPFIDDQQSDMLLEDPDEEYLRIWTAPDLTDPEYLDLLKVYPSFITRQTLPRFPTDTKNVDLEAGFDASIQIRFGTGIMWVSSKPRRPGWQGSWWTRFVLWLRRTFC